MGGGVGVDGEASGLRKDASMNPGDRCSSVPLSQLGRGRLLPGGPSLSCRRTHSLANTAQTACQPSLVPLGWGVTIPGGPIRCSRGLLIEAPPDPPPLPTHIRRSLADGSDCFLSHMAWKVALSELLMDTPSGRKGGKERRAAPAGEPRGLSVR